jgi:predicted nucleic acid-binding protein
LLITPADWDIGRRAGQLRARRYRRGSASFSLGDCMALSTAISFRKPLATSDAALAELARQEGVEVIALPNSRGEKP